MASSGSLWVSLGIRTEQFKKGLKKAKGNLSTFEKFGKRFGQVFDPFNIATAAAFGLGVAIKDAVETINAFQKANSELKAIVTATDAELASMAQQAKDLGASTSFTATEVVNLQKSLAKLGFDPTQIQNMTDATLALAAASGTELDEAATQVGATLNAFGLNSQDATHVTDVMALAFASSALDMEKFSETMKNAAPIAKATGVSLETATAAAGKLADANITGSKAGTDLKKIFSELVKDGKPFAESLEDIAKKMNATTDPAEKLAIAEKLVGDRAKGALLILAEQREGLGTLSDALVGADGDAKAMADTMLDNVSGSMTKASSAYEGFILSIEDGDGIISKAMQSIVDSFTETLGLLTQFNESDLGFFERVAQLVNPVARDLIKVRDAGKEVKETVEEVAEVMPDLAESTDEATEGLTELTAAQKKAAVEARNAKNALVDFINTDTSKLKPISDAVKDIFEGIKKEGAKPRLAIPVTPELVVDAGFEGEDPRITDEMVKMGEDAGYALSSSLQGAAQEGLVGLGEMLGGKEMGNFGEAFIGGFSNLLKSFGEQMIALGLGMIALQAALEAGPFGAGLAIAGGVALIALATAVKGTLSSGAEEFANGGLVTGETMGIVGEGRGTTRSNPEVIAPLDKLKNFIQPQGMGGGQVTFRIEGNTLVGILNRQGKNAKYSE